MYFKKTIAIAGLIIVSILLSACFDKIELEEQGYVAAIGLDNGKDGNLRITFQITNPTTGIGVNTGISQGQGNLKATSDIITVEAPGILVARDMVSVSVTRKISLAHAKILIIGEEFAQDEKFFHYLESTLREKEMRRSIDIMVSREPASEFIRNNHPTLETRPEKFYSFMAIRWKDTGYVPPNSNLNNFLERIESKGGLFLTIYGTAKNYAEKNGRNEGDYLPGQMKKEGSNPSQLIGSAVFKDGRMIGKLTGNETRLVTLLRPKPEVKNMFFSIPDPLDNRYKLACRVSKHKHTSVEIDTTENGTVINVTVPVKVDLLAIPSFIDYPEDLKKQEILKASMENHFNKEALDLIKKTQQEYKAEPFLWRLVLRKKFLTNDDYEKYNWSENYLSAKVNVKFLVRLESFGKQLNPPQLKWFDNSNVNTE